MVLERIQFIYRCQSKNIDQALTTDDKSLLFLDMKALFSDTFFTLKHVNIKLKNRYGGDNHGFYNDLTNKTSIGFDDSASSIFYLHHF